MILSGLDLLSREAFSRFKGKKLAVLVHGASVDQYYTHMLDLLKQNEIDLRVVFGPEHGASGAMQDMEGAPEEASLTRYISLYDGTYESLFPKAADLGDVDYVLIDLQDVGSRYYTYVYTAAFLIEAATERNIPVTVLDRPNPIGGASFGNMIQPGYTSFVGYYPLFPNQHGLTIGEMLLLINDQKIKGDLSVIKMEGYQRISLLRQDYAWVLPSPNMPMVETAHLYPGGCLIEGTNLSEGRGTTRPFHQIGAPYVDGERLKAALDRYQFPGIGIRSCNFKPMFQKHGGSVCGGIELHLTDGDQLNSLELFLALIYECYHLFPAFQWRRDTYEFLDEPIAIDLLFGTDEIRLMIERGDSFEAIRDHFLIDLSDYREMVTPYLLY